MDTIAMNIKAAATFRTFWKSNVSIAPPECRIFGPPVIGRGRSVFWSPETELFTSFNVVGGAAGNVFRRRNYSAHSLQAAYSPPPGFAQQNRTEHKKHKSEHKKHKKYAPYDF